MRYDHVVLIATEDAADHARSLPGVLLRMVGHLIVDRMPDEGMPETLENLASLHRFYLNRQHRLPPETAAQRIPAVVSPPVKRPEFEFEAPAE